MDSLGVTAQRIVERAVAAGCIDFLYAGLRDCSPHDPGGEIGGSSADGEVASFSMSGVSLPTAKEDPGDVVRSRVREHLEAILRCRLGERGFPCPASVAVRVDRCKDLVGGIIVTAHVAMAPPPVARRSRRAAQLGDAGRAACCASCGGAILAGSRA